MLIENIILRLIVKGTVIESYLHTLVQRTCMHETQIICVVYLMKLFLSNEALKTSLELLSLFRQINLRLIF